MEVETFHPYGVIRARFLYDAVNEPLPAAAFAVPKLEGVSPSLPEALDVDYTNRFVTHSSLACHGTLWFRQRGRLADRVVLCRVRLHLEVLNPLLACERWRSARIFS